MELKLTYHLVIEDLNVDWKERKPIYVLKFKHVIQCLVKGSRERCSRLAQICVTTSATTGALSSCQNRCNESYDASKPCHCDEICSSYDNCCNDYDQVCASISERYLCKGECDVSRGKCNCTSSCVEDKNCCSDYAQSCQGELPWSGRSCANVTERCPPGYEDPIVILFSIDGFRAEYIYRDLTPNIWKLADCGVHAPYMRSVYPTKTFPNHYTIATGLYPESHGIIDNKMYDHDLEEEFKLGTPESLDPHWWGGEPIWVTTSNQGKKSACFFWPGSDVNITRYPDYYYKYDGSVDNEERMYQALEWLDLPKEERPSLITLYMDIVDRAGHNYGPDSSGVNDALTEADRVIGILMDGLQIRKMENCVNIIMLADHGMAPISCNRKTSLEDYGVNMDVVYTRTGAFGRVGKSKDPSEWDQFSATETHEKLRCKHNETHWQSFLKYQYLPKRYHYANNDRIEPVLLTMDDEWLVEGRKGSDTECDGGAHGFDNEFKSMHALFAAHGPRFKEHYNTTTPFENIEIYNLIAALLNLNPAPNNGTSGSLNHVMKSPKPVEPLPINTIPDQCDQFDENNLDSTCAACEGISDKSAYQRLQLSTDKVTQAQELHFPFGRPQVEPAGLLQLTDEIAYCLMTQSDYVLAYDKLKKLPFYAAFTLNDIDRNLVSPDPCMRLDPRLPQMTLTCDDFQRDTNINSVSLYPGELSNGDAMYDAAILSNQVPMYNSASRVWNYMTLSLADWANRYGGINVVAGPAFDYDYDGLADAKHVLERNAVYLDKNANSSPIPTHYFLVVTRCANVGTPLSECVTSLKDLEVLSFIIPNYVIEPCHTSDQPESEWIPGTLMEHVARLRDVELISGISFFTSSTHSESASQDEIVTALRKKLHLPEFTSQWLVDFRAGIRSSGYTITCNSFHNLLLLLANSFLLMKLL